MSVKRTDLTGNIPDALTDAQEIQAVVKETRFADALSQLDAQTRSVEQGTSGTSGTSQAVRAALAQIARNANLANGEQAAQAVQAAATCLIRLRFQKKFKQTAQVTKLVKNLSEYVAADPFLSARLLGILTRLKNEGNL